MKSQSQLMMVALTIAFATALALAVALVCISHLKEGPPENDTDWLTVWEPDTESIDESSQLPTLTDKPETEPPILSDPSNGLRYVGNGNGTCRLVSIGSCTDACVVIPEQSPTGERVTEIDARAFYGCMTVTAVQIPATVRRIGELAFAACPNLVYISVSAQSLDYRDIDGILYSFDERVLIQYPARRAGSEVRIRAVTTEICDMAFYDCKYLSLVRFEGSAEQWEKMHIGNKNYSLTAAAKTFLGGENTSQ